jgi:hypothetical protein
MAMRVDEAWHHDAVRRVDDVGVRAHGEVAPDGRDFVAVDEHVGQRQIAKLGIERQHVAAFDQRRPIGVWASADHPCLPAPSRAKRR